MKLIMFSARMAGLAFVLAVLAAIPAYGQQGRIQISQLDKLGDRSVEMIDVTVDESLLQLAAKFLNDKVPDQAKAKELISNLKGIYVRRYVFENEGEYSTSDSDSIRSQLTTPGWSRIVGVRSKKRDKNINVDVFLMSEGAIIRGLAVLATESKAFTVVNIVGPIDLEKLSQLEGKFGIPSLQLIQTGSEPRPEPEQTTKPPKE
ncbi:MAG TPA: DUF4252 domain-containing protein [Blastocatellia bacterium]|jgi:hypothetical protein|nr:DUF4252 domain-containing protein [Blastocatellia bacterium]